MTKIKNMIITKLIGGLGNQMFQYAFGRSQSIRHHTILKLDISHFENDKFRTYSLDCFNIEAEIAENSEIAEFTCGRINKTLNIIRDFKNKKNIRERFFHFDPEVLKTKKNIYLNGYWQSEKYFSAQAGESALGEKDIENIIRKDFSLKNKPSSETEKWLEEIKNHPSVSIHIRRGDYVANPKVTEIHGLCDLDYYKKAIKYISEKIKSPIFFAFSDDINWVKDNLKTDFPLHFVSNKKIPDYEEMILMSACQHNIIANSSFSWWGAWLNSNPKKQVIAPSAWFLDKSKDTKDLIPKTWTTL